MERTFFFGVLPSKYSGSVAGRNAIRTRQSKNYFLREDKDFTLPRLLFQNDWDFVSAAQEGAGGMRGGFLTGS